MRGPARPAVSYPRVGARVTRHAQPRERSTARCQRPRSVSRSSRHPRLVARRLAPALTTSPVPDRPRSRPGRRRRAQSSRRSRAPHRHAQDVRLKLHEPIVRDGAAVGLAARSGARPTPPPARAPRRPSGRRSPPAPRGPGAPGRAAGEADDRAARVRVPVRRAETRQRRDEVDAVVRVERAASASVSAASR